jgi:hypothetical protein
MSAGKPIGGFSGPALDTASDIGLNAGALTRAEEALIIRTAGEP